jgi:hypothetical protein
MEIVASSASLSGHIIAEPGISPLSVDEVDVVEMAPNWRTLN